MAAWGMGWAPAGRVAVPVLLVAAARGAPGRAGGLLRRRHGGGGHRPFGDGLGDAGVKHFLVLGVAQ